MQMQYSQLGMYWVYVKVPKSHIMEGLQTVVVVVDGETTVVDDEVIVVKAIVVEVTVVEEEVVVAGTQAHGIPENVFLQANPKGHHPPHLPCESG
jgi:hypothetical protein